MIGSAANTFGIFLPSFVGDYLVTVKISSRALYIGNLFTLDYTSRSIWLLAEMPHVGQRTRLVLFCFGNLFHFLVPKRPLFFVVGTLKMETRMHLHRMRVCPETTWIWLTNPELSCGVAPRTASWKHQSLSRRFKYSSEGFLRAYSLWIRPRDCQFWIVLLPLRGCSIILSFVWWLEDVDQGWLEWKSFVPGVSSCRPPSGCKCPCFWRRGFGCCLSVKNSEFFSPCRSRTRAKAKGILHHWI